MLRIAWISEILLTEPPFLNYVNCFVSKLTGLSWTCQKYYIIEFQGYITSSKQNGEKECRLDLGVWLHMSKWVLIRGGSGAG